MATTKLTVKDGLIAGHMDRYFQFLSEDGKRYEGNGWTVEIRDGRNGRPGRIVCHAEREYSDGVAICHREFRLADGIVGLAGGNIHARYAYFRTEKFSAWLREHELQSVQRVDPNQAAFFSSNPYGNTWSHDLLIETDGEVSLNKYIGKRYMVSGATYAVVRRHYCDGIRWHTEPGILYTLEKDVMSLL